MDNGNKTSNGKDVPATLVGLLRYVGAEYGGIGIVCFVLALGFYWFALVPMADERQIYRETLEETIREGKLSQNAIVSATERIADGIKLHQLATEKLSDTLKSMAYSDQVNRDALDRLQIENAKIHERQTELLEKIMALLDVITAQLPNEPKP